MVCSPALVAALLSPQGCAVLAGGHAGQVVRLVRTALGWTQTELGNRSGWSQSTISRIEEGKTRAAQDMRVLADLAQALDIPPIVLGVADDLGQAPILDGVDRREVLGGTVALAVTVLLPHGVATAGRIDSDDVAQCWTALRRLEELDANQGSAAIYQVAEGMAQRLRDAFQQGSYPPAVGHELQRVTLAAMDQAGWLTYDAGFPQQARRWWLETCHLADLAGIPEARVSAMTTMALQAVENPRSGEEAAELAQAARATAGVGATPTLLSLLSAREAIGHARTGDRSAAMTSMAQAHHWLDRGQRGEEPFWLDFWGPADLAWHETRLAMIIRDGKVAEKAARVALGSVNITSFPRNHINYAVALGSVLTQLGQLDEAISVTSTAVQGVHAVRGSGRTVADLHRTLDLLGQRNYPPARAFAAATRRLLPVPV